MSSAKTETSFGQGVTQANRPPKGTLGLKELYALSIGQVIGAGVITLVGPALGMTGYSAWLGYFMAIIFGFFIILPLVFITGTIRMGGGYYSLISATTSKQVAGMFAVAQLTGMLSLSLFGLALGLYINSVFPNVPPRLCGMLLLTFFWIVNLRGIDFMASAQKLMTWILIVVLLMFIVAGFMNLNNPIFDVSNPQFMPKGINGLLLSMFLFSYSTTGYSLTMNYGVAAQNATRDIPKALLLSVPTITILYVGVAMAGAGVLPLEQVIGKPLTVVARAILPNVLFILFILGGPVMALTTTMNSSMPSQCLPVMRSCEDGWFPKSYSSLNKRGVAWKIFTTHYIVGMIPMLLNFNVSTITNNILLFNALRSLMQIYAYFKIPSTFPDAWAKSRYHIPNALYYFFCLICLVAQIAIFIYSARALTPTIAIISTIVTIICCGYGLLRSKSPEIKITASVWAGNDEPDTPLAVECSVSASK